MANSITTSLETDSLLPPSLHAILTTQLIQPQHTIYVILAITLCVYRSLGNVIMMHLTHTVSSLIIHIHTL